ncbi:kinase [Nocardia asteroides]|uniref:kinase n=1 Tax=Nocardia asteroides TaxID=1824 RepID=UPI00378E8EE9
MKSGVILFGGPATGKDTVTRALSRLDARYRLFERLKAGPGRTEGYRMTDSSELERLDLAGELVYVNSRYGARYAIDKPTLTALATEGFIPVVHAGQPQVIDALREAMPDIHWTVVQLQCTTETARRRIADRATGDDSERLAAREETPSILADLTIDTDHIQPAQAADLIADRAAR